MPTRWERIENTIIDLMTKEDTSSKIVPFLQDVANRGEDLGYCFVREVMRFAYRTFPPKLSNNPHPEIPSPNCEVVVQQFRGKKLIDGAYTVKSERLHVLNCWVANSELNANPWRQDDMNLAMMQVLESGRIFGACTPTNSAAAKGLRDALEVMRFPITYKDEEFLKYSRDLKSKSLGSLTLACMDIATSCAPVMVHTPIARLMTGYYHHGGATRVWYIVSPAQASLFEAEVQKLVHGRVGTMPCAMFVQHQSLWLDPSLVRSWGVEVTVVDQKAGELVFHMPFSYVWGFSKGYLIIEKRLFSTEDWETKRRGYVPCDEIICSEKLTLGDRVMGIDTRPLGSDTESSGEDEDEDIEGDVSDNDHDSKGVELMPKTLKPGVAIEGSAVEKDAVPESETVDGNSATASLTTDTNAKAMAGSKALISDSIQHPIVQLEAMPSTQTLKRSLSDHLVDERSKKRQKTSTSDESCEHGEGRYETMFHELSDNFKNLSHNYNEMVKILGTLAHDVSELKKISSTTNEKVDVLTKNSNTTNEKVDVLDKKLDVVEAKIDAWNGSETA